MSLRLVPFRCAYFSLTAVYGAEFYVGLQPSDNFDAAVTSWRTMKHAAQAVEHPSVAGVMRAGHTGVTTTDLRHDPPSAENVAEAARVEAYTRRHGALSMLMRRLRVLAHRNPLFDAKWYVSRYPDVQTTRAYRHWTTTGWREGRDPSAEFDTAWYLGSNPDVRAAELNPLDHYYVFGAAEGRLPVPPRHRSN